MQTDLSFTQGSLAHQASPWIGVSMGDPNGIGPEVILKAYLNEPQTLQHALVFAYKGVLTRAIDVLGASKKLRLVPMCIEQETRTPPKGSPLEPFSGPVLGPVSGPLSKQVAWTVQPQTHDPVEPGLTSVCFVDIGALSSAAQSVFIRTQLDLPSTGLARLSPMGQMDAQSGEMAARAIVLGARAALHGLTRALVTAPIHKGSLGLAGWTYPGHTELLQAECADFLGQSLEAVPVRMMLKNHEIAVVLVSIHLSLRQAIERVNFENVLQTVMITHEALSRSLGRRPKIALSALNPHAGEGGLMGHEEQEVLEPVVLKAQDLGLDVQGPFSADTLYMRARQMRLSQLTAQSSHASHTSHTSHSDTPTEPFDVVIAMYHDQGLIPVKYMGLDEGVNITLGLPLVRTSPDHGTAFDIAGSGRCDERSFLQAFRQAQEMAGASIKT